MKQIKEVLLKIALSCVFWFSCSAYAADAVTYDRSTPQAAFLSLIDAAQQGDFKGIIESFDLDAVFESDPKLKQLKLNAEQQQEFLLQMESKIQPGMQELKDHLDKNGGVKNVVFESTPEEVDGWVIFKASVFFNNGEQSGPDDVKMINRNGIYKMLPPGS